MQNFATALALMLVFEGVLPLVSPSSWRTLARRLSALADGQIRFFGLVSVVAGVLLLLFLLD